MLQKTQSSSTLKTQDATNGTTTMSSPTSLTHLPVENSIATNGNAALNAHTAIVAGAANPAKTPYTRYRRGFSFYFHAYMAALFSMGVWVHCVASVVTAAIYFAPTVYWLPFWGTSWYAPFNGSLITYALYLLLAVPFSFFSTAQGANMRSYGLLLTRLNQLKARLGLEELPDKARADTEARARAARLDTRENFRLIALHEANECYRAVNDLLTKQGSGQQWVLGTGYINAWGLLHRAEESLIEVEPLELVVRAALHDKWALQDSTISNRDELLQILIQAVEEISPEAAVYFKEHQPYQSSSMMMRQETTRSGRVVTGVRKVAVKMPFISTFIQRTDTQTTLVTNASHAGARSALHEVRRTLNQFRDNLWEGLVRARNQLLGTIAVVSFVTHFLICFAILSDTTFSHYSNIEAATVFYIIGAVAGLFARFYREANNNSAVDDYGLSMARLSATPLLSGLAGVGGVLISVLAYGILGGNTPPTIGQIFQISDPRYLITAAIFGLAPQPHSERATRPDRKVYVRIATQQHAHHE